MQFKDEEVQVFFGFTKKGALAESFRKSNGADIFLYVNHYCNKELDQYFPYDFMGKINYFFILEFLCSCIMRGNRMKKNCVYRKTNKGANGEYKSYDCIPKLIADKIMIFLLEEWKLDLFLEGIV